MIEQIDKNIYQPYLESVDQSIGSLLAKREKTENREELIMLDAGCGHSSILSDQYKKCSKVIGVDLDKDGLEKNIWVDQKVYADLCQIPLPDSSVNIYTSAWVLEHIEEPEKFIAEMSRVLKSSGYFIFIAPNKNSVYAFLTRLIPHRFHELFTKNLYGRGEGDTFPAFYRMNSESKLDSLLQKSGFEKISFIYNDDVKYFGFSRLTIIFAKIWHKLIMFNSLKKYRVHIIGVYKKS